MPASVGVGGGGRDSPNVVREVSAGFDRKGDRAGGGNHGGEGLLMALPDRPTVPDRRKVRVWVWDWEAGLGFRVMESDDATSAPCDGRSSGTGAVSFQLVSGRSWPAMRLFGTDECDVVPVGLGLGLGLGLDFALRACTCACGLLVPVVATVGGRRTGDFAGGGNHGGEEERRRLGCLVEGRAWEVGDKTSSSVSSLLPAASSVEAVPVTEVGPAADAGRLALDPTLTILRTGGGAFAVAAGLGALGEGNCGTTGTVLTTNGCSKIGSVCSGCSNDQRTDAAARAAGENRRDRVGDARADLGRDVERSGGGTVCSHHSLSWFNAAARCVGSMAGAFRNLSINCRIMDAPPATGAAEVTGTDDGGGSACGAIAGRTEEAACITNEDSTSRGARLSATACNAKAPVGS